MVVGCCEVMDLGNSCLSHGAGPRLTEMFPVTEPGRYWNHRTVNVLDHLPRKLEAQARELL